MKTCYVCDSTDDEVPIISKPTAIYFNGETNLVLPLKEDYICIECLQKEMYLKVDTEG